KLSERRVTAMLPFLPTVECGTRALPAEFAGRTRGRTAEERRSERKMRWRQWRTPVLPEAGAAKLLPEVCAFERDSSAHFVETGAHSFSNTISPRFTPSGSPGGRQRTGNPPRPL